MKGSCFWLVGKYETCLQCLCKLLLTDMKRWYMFCNFSTFLSKSVEMMLQPCTNPPITLHTTLLAPPIPGFGLQSQILFMPQRSWFDIKCNFTKMALYLFSNRDQFFMQCPNDQDNALAQQICIQLRSVKWFRGLQASTKHADLKMQVV